MHPLQVVAECTLEDQFSFCVAGLGLCTRIGVKLTSGAHGSSISMWQSSWFNQPRYPCPPTNLPPPKVLFRLGWFFEYTFWTWEGQHGVHLARPSLTSPSGGHLARPSFFGAALGKAFCPFTFFCGTRGGGGHLARPPLPSPSVVTHGVPEEGGIATQPMHSQGSPTPSAGTKSEKATSPLPSRGPKRGRNCYVTPAFSGVPNKREENQKWLPHPCLLGVPKEG